MDESPQDHRELELRPPPERMRHSDARDVLTDPPQHMHRTDRDGTSSQFFQEDRQDRLHGDEAHSENIERTIRQMHGNILPEHRYMVRRMVGWCGK